MPTPVNRCRQKHRDALRAAGLRPTEISVPDTRRPGFAEERLRQTRIVAAADAEERELEAFMDAALLDMDSEREA